LFKSPTYLLLDNVHKLDSAPLAGAITAESWTDRKMGSSESPAIPVRCAWVATGNHPARSDELARRIVQIRMDAKMEHPHLRADFRHPNLRDYIKAHRHELVAAAITLVRAWQAAGQPRGTKTLGMFESWAQIVGGILTVAGQPGFLVRDEAQSSNVIALPWVRFFGRWWVAFGDRPVGVASLFPLLHSDTDVPIDLGLPKDADEEGHRIAFGKDLSSRRDQYIGSFCVRASGTHQSARQWRLERADEPNRSEPVREDRAA
jgi:hypothetical protein